MSGDPMTRMAADWLAGVEIRLNGLRMDLASAVPGSVFYARLLREIAVAEDDRAHLSRIAYGTERVAA